MAFAAEHTFGQIALAGAGEVALPLDVRYRYTVSHTGDDVDGNDDPNSALSGWLTTKTSSVAADKSIQDNKYELMTDTSVTVGPGISKLYIVSGAGADAVIQIVRIGTPTNSY